MARSRETAYDIKMNPERHYLDAIQNGWPFAVDPQPITDCEHEWTRLEDGRPVCVYCNELLGEDPN